MATATAMYHSGRNPLKGISRDPRKSESVDVIRGDRRRRLHKAFLRWHDPDNWPLLRQALKDMGRADLIGNGKHHLIPLYQPAKGAGDPFRGKASGLRPGRALTQHTGLPPRSPGKRTRG
jgi:hypothetical protein